MVRTLQPGKPFPQGATWDGLGVNFAIYSESATGVELCLFDYPNGSTNEERIRLPEVTGGVWHGYAAGLKPGQLYGYRVYGPFEPVQGHRFNPAKLLIDPYARALAGTVNWNEPLFAYQFDSPEQDLSCDPRDSCAGVPKGVVTNTHFDWSNDRPPLIPMHESIIYEVHVKGFTKLHPDIPEELRGTYAGLASPPAIEYLQKLGVTAVELLPVHAFLQDKILLDRGLRNYWGYNTVNYFAPEASYSAAGDRGEQVSEFKAMVKALHAAGIEVILDVVYNHTAEGNHLGPTLSFRGVDNLTYYRTVAENPRYYMDYTGCGNTLNVRHPQVLKLIMDSLRYWVQEMHVDGFRFDLASALAREMYDVDRLSAFFDVINQDPVISQVKLIAEPWDVGMGGYQVGNFPALWAEWNGKYRDAVRRYWKGDDGMLAELGYRLTGSSDLYQRDGRHPSASINFVTAHDGFSLHDLVSYNEKHNEANGEGNRDGADDNHSWNHGAEGPTDDKAVNDLRERQKRNFLATMLLSQGVPMICGGDELSLTRFGNNNGYCQDNELNWFNWEYGEAKAALIEFTRMLIALRKAHPNLHRRKYFQGRAINPAGETRREVRGQVVKDIMWIRPDGHEMAEDEWTAGWVRCLGVRLSGKTLDEYDVVGEPIEDDTFLILLNPHHEPIRFYLPKCEKTRDWQLVLDTKYTEQVDQGLQIPSGQYYELIPRSMAVFVESEVKQPPRSITDVL
ncbi:MAG: glycogen debranching protein GlgX [Bryobacteraceae bacterium]|nr:glycogen debranching protein GlgX [Bryobacteraceae bacterium]